MRINSNNEGGSTLQQVSCPFGKGGYVNLFVPIIPAEVTIFEETVLEYELDEMTQRIANVAEKQFTLHAINHFIDAHQCNAQELVKFLTAKDRDRKYFYILGYIYYNGLQSIKVDMDKVFKI